jgi:hypothetical protein
MSQNQQVIVGIAVVAVIIAITVYVFSGSSPTTATLPQTPAQQTPAGGTSGTGETQK